MIKLYKKLIQKLNNLITVIHEKILGIDTFKYVPVEELGLSEKRSHHYSPSGNRYLKRVLDDLSINTNDSIIDFGSGKGSALLLMSQYPFREITGIELSQDLHLIAHKNIQKLNIKNVTLYCCDAAEFSDINKYNIFYFYNPFPCNVMENVVKNIYNSLLNNYRKIIIIYKMPKCNDIIVRYGFKKIREYDSEYSNIEPKHKFYIYSNFS